jgi:hypothetical protein
MYAPRGVAADCLVHQWESRAKFQEEQVCHAQRVHPRRRQGSQCPLRPGCPSRRSGRRRPPAIDLVVWRRAIFLPAALAPPPCARSRSLPSVLSASSTVACRISRPSSFPGFEAGIFGFPSFSDFGNSISSNDNGVDYEVVRPDIGHARSGALEQSSTNPPAGRRLRACGDIALTSGGRASGQCILISNRLHGSRNSGWMNAARSHLHESLAKLSSIAIGLGGKCESDILL